MITEYVESEIPTSTEEEAVEPEKHINASKNMPALCELYGPETFTKEFLPFYKKLSDFELDGIRRVMAAGIHEVA